MKWVTTVDIVNIYHLTELNIVFPWVELFKIYCLSNFEIYSTQYNIFNYSHTLYILHPQDLLYNSKFIPFDHLHLFHPSPTFGNQQTLQDPQ